MINSALYRSKPQLVEAIQWTGHNYDEIKAFCPQKVSIADQNLLLLAGKDGAQEWVPVPLGHWLVHPPGDISDIWPVEHTYFITKYELATDE